MLHSESIPILACMAMAKASSLRSAFMLGWLLASPTKVASSRSPPTPMTSNKSVEERCCFVGSNDARCQGRTTSKDENEKHGLCASPKSKTNAEASPNTNIIMDSDGNNYEEFNLEKARLMARFASVAYEDPPKSTRKAGMSRTPSIEQFVDDYGVSITRPVPSKSKSQHDTKKITSDGSNDWDMAHTEATSPRPLMPMLSGCNTPSFDKGQFQWVGLATNQKTSAQFDAWRIIGSDSKTDNDAGSNTNDILVIAFRGTRLSSYLDLLTDIQLKQDMIQCSDFGVCMKDDRIDDEKEEQALMAHSGFLAAYSSIRSSLLQLLSENAGTYNQLWFTGHSLGAALATLALADVASIMDSDCQECVTLTPTMNASSSKQISKEQKTVLNLPRAKLSSYIFGTPRVGNQSFANRLARLLRQSRTISEYYRINTPGDAVVFLPRGKVVNRLDIDYVHAGPSVFLPAVKEQRNENDNAEKDAVNDMDDEATVKESYRQWMMQLEEDTIERINQRILEPNESSDDTIPYSNTKDPGKNESYNNNNSNLLSTKIKIYPQGDSPPDPLSEIDPGYSGFFPLDPRTWVNSRDFQNFLVGEAVRSFRILRGGFVKNHQLKTYEDGLCLASQEDVVVVV